MHQNDIDPAREQRCIDGKPLEQVFRCDGRAQQRRAIDAGASQDVACAFRQAPDLQDQRRRAVGIFIAAEAKAIQVRQRVAVADQCKLAAR